MHRFFIQKDELSGNTIYISGDDAVHISRVLRLRTGDNIIISDGEGYEYLCSISEMDKNRVCCNILEKNQVKSECLLKIVLYQGIPKSTKMDLIVQKCTELGVNEITPVDTERVIIRMDMEKDLKGKITRWQRIAEEAAKQSGRGIIPRINNPVTFAESIKCLNRHDIAVMPYEKEGITGLKHTLRGKNNIDSVGILIGPEGGFTEQEVIQASENNIVPVTLGPRILRTETAGFTSIIIINYELGDMGGELWEK